ncbi:protein of unknown function [Azospirillum lipoferum 4B]|uniref:Uncharacterized protein n=1 Tax=Azospirillum lipoferum (strain 4B) TaxID=862719 RepID=G7Z661_AZOL4|nr:protein of unknown function [Azospirillum lipoferum 4B]
MHPLIHRAKLVAAADDTGACAPVKSAIRCRMFAKAAARPFKELRPPWTVALTLSSDRHSHETQIHRRFDAMPLHNPAGQP